MKINELMLISPTPLPTSHFLRMIVTLSAATAEASSIRSLNPQAQFLQSYSRTGWVPGPLSILFGVFLQGAPLIQRGTTAVITKRYRSPQELFMLKYLITFRQRLLQSGSIISLLSSSPCCPQQKQHTLFLSSRLHTQGLWWIRTFS